MSGSENLASFAYHIFYFRRPQGLRLAFDAAKRNGRFGSIRCQKSKEGISRGKRKRGELLCRRTVRVEEKQKVIPASFLKLKERGRLLGRKIGEKKPVSKIGR